ncbi:MAG: hypothetical protein VW405_10860, partial [Rhodospirillaceae bacterium]
MHDIMVDDGSGSDLGYRLEARKVLISDLLREIKNNRMLDASFHTARIKEGAKAEAARRVEAPNDDPAENFTAPGREAPAEVEDAFDMALQEMLARRLEPLTKDVDAAALNGRTLPFAVSRAFSQRLIEFVGAHMAGEMRAPCRTFV